MFEPEVSVVHTVVPVGQAGEQIAVMAPGSELAYLLERADLDGADDYTVVETAAAWQRLVGWASAGAARAAAVLADRASMNPAWPASAGRVGEPNVAGEELALRLGCSRRQARMLVRDGRAFAGALTWTGDALAAGEIDPTKARILVGALADVPVPLALDVQEAVLPGAPRRTPTQLARDVARELIACDPQGAAERHEVATEGRRVERPRVLPDGMAKISAILPATGAVRLDSALDSLARGARAAGDSRTLDQLRADVLVDLTTGQVEGSAAWMALVSRPEAPAASVDGVSGGTGSLSDAPDGVDAPGAHTPDGGSCTDGSQSDAPHGVDTPGAHTPDGGSCTDGSQNDAPHGVGADGAGSGFVTAGTGRPGGCGQFPGTAARTQIRVTVPLSTLIGLDDQPADLAGHGPITAEAARALARGGTWQRIVTDPLTGRVLDVGRTRYRPPADLIAHVQTRDGTCASPTCSARAESCDVDHTIAYHRDGGPTSATNLGPLCKRDHQVKTDGGFRLVQVEPGVFEWTTPTGHTYRTVPGDDAAYQAPTRDGDESADTHDAARTEDRAGLDALLRRLGLPGHAPTPRQPPSDPKGEPPF